MPYCVTYVPGMPCNLCVGKLIRSLAGSLGFPAIRQSLMAFNTRKAVLCKQRVSHPLAPTNMTLYVQ